MNKIIYLIKSNPINNKFKKKKNTDYHKSKK